MCIQGLRTRSCSMRWAAWYITLSSVLSVSVAFGMVLSSLWGSFSRSRERHNQILDRWFDATEARADNLTQDLIETQLSLQVEGISDYLSILAQTAHSLNAVVRIESDNYTQPWESDQLEKELPELLSLMRSGRKVGLVGLGVVLSSPLQSYAGLVGTPVNSSEDNTVMVAGDKRTRRLYTVTRLGDALPTDTWPFAERNPILPEVQTLADDVSPGELVWMPPALFGESQVCDVLIPLGTPKWGVAFARFELRRLDDIMYYFAHKVDGMRLFVYSPETGTLVAKSHGSDVRPTPITNASDAVIRGAGSIALDPVKRPLAMEQREVVPLVVEGREVEYLVATAPLDMRMKGRWEVGLAFPGNEVVMLLGLSVRKELMAAADEVYSKARKDALIRVGLVAAVVCCFIGLSAAASSCLIRPLQELQTQMRVVASLDLDQVDEQQSRSYFKEVAEMQDSFLLMLRRLKEFRPFIPAYVLQPLTAAADGESYTTGSSTDPDDDSDCPSPLPPRTSWTDASPASPKAPAGDSIAFVFTDIQGSTRLWEASSRSMSRALHLHNTIMREVLQEAGGYEVKTIGDAFMVAFENVFAAAQFALAAQVALVEAEWPASLLRHPLCGKQEEPPLWNGLRVRMGIHYGPAVAEENPVTGRCDYFGPTVNAAARIEGVAAGGVIMASQLVVDMLGGGGLHALGDPVVFPMGARHLSGLADTISLVGMLPQSLAGRRWGVEELPPLPPLPPPPPPPPSTVILGQQGQLKGSSATVAVTRTAAPFAALAVFDAVATAAAGAADRTGGMMMAAARWCVTTVFVGRRHASRAAWYAGLLHELLPPQHRSWSHTGLVSGTVFLGDVGGARQRFSTVLGCPVDLAATLSRAGQRIGAFVLSGAVPGGDTAGPAQEEPFHARVVGFLPYGEAGQTCAVCELKAPALVPTGDAWDRLSGDSDPWTTLPLRQAVLSPDPTLLLALSASRPDDAVLARLALLHSEGSPLFPDPFIPSCVGEGA